MSQPELAYDGKVLPSHTEIKYIDLKTLKDRPENPQIVKDMQTSHLAKDNFNRLVDPKDTGDPLIGQFIDQLDYHYPDNSGADHHETFDHWMRYNLISATVAGVNPAYVFMFLIYKALRTKDQQLLKDINQVADLSLGSGHTKPTDETKEPGNVPDKSVKSGSLDSTSPTDNEVTHAGSSASASLTPDDLFDDPNYIQPLSPADLPFDDTSDNVVSNPASNSLSHTDVSTDNGMSQSERPAGTGQSTVSSQPPVSQPDNQPGNIPFGQSVDWGGSGYSDEESSSETGTKSGGEQTVTGGDQAGNSLDNGVEEQSDDGQDDWLAKPGDNRGDLESDQAGNAQVDQPAGNGPDDNELPTDQLPDPASPESDINTADQAADEYFDDKQTYQADIPTANVNPDTNEALNDKFDLNSSLFEIKNTPIGDGLFNLHYRIKDKEMKRASVLTPLFDVMKAILLDEIHDPMVVGLVDKLSYGDVITAYFIYTAAREEQISRRLYERYCLAYGLLTLTTRQADMLRQSKSLGAILKNNELPPRVRWFLYMNKHAPQAKRDMLSRVFNRLDQISDTLDVQTALMAGQLSAYDEADWPDMLYGTETKRALKEIDDSHDDLVSPLKTMRRTRQVRRRNRRK